MPQKSTSSRGAMRSGMRRPYAAARSAVVGRGPAAPRDRRDGTPAREALDRAAPIAREASRAGRATTAVDWYGACDGTRPEDPPMNTIDAKTLKPVSYTHLRAHETP